MIFKAEHSALSAAAAAPSKIAAKWRKGCGVSSPRFLTSLDTNLKETLYRMEDQTFFAATSLAK
jgi:hypothetical protein